MPSKIAYQMAQKLRDDMHKVLQLYSDMAQDLKISYDQQEATIMCALVQTMICFTKERELVTTPEEYFARGRKHYEDLDNGQTIN